jgi:predicted nucleotidyltransferase
MLSAYEAARSRTAVRDRYRSGMATVESALAGMTIWPHHTDTIQRVSDHFEADPGVRALLLTGSLAHGFATGSSDVDIVVVLDDDEWERRRDATSLTYLNHDLATYEGGYVDGKFVSLPFLRDVADRGGDATRWGYDGARILFTRTPELAPLLDAVVAFPRAEQASRRTRFAAQLLAWRWYGEQGREKGDPYLQGISLNRVVLFACRLVLNENELLYPFHKWMLRVTENARHRPAGLVTRIRELYAAPTQDSVDALVFDLLAFYGIDRAEADRTWGAWFMRDTELSWMTGPPPVDDL